MTSLVLLLTLPAATGVCLLVLGRRADRVAGPLAVVSTVIAVVLAGVVADRRPRVSLPFLGIVDGGDLLFAVDGLSAVLVVLVAVVALLITVFAVVDLRPQAARARFFGFFLLFIAAMSATVTAVTFPALLLGWEVMGATSYALIGYHWQEPGKLNAGARAFLTTRAGDLGLYVAAGAALAGTGGLLIGDTVSAADGWQDVAAAGVLVAALGKSAQLPFSAWLSGAMQGPSPVSALLHSATMVAAGGYLLLRTQPLLAQTGWAASTAAWAGGLTALVMGAIAVAQRDLKQLLAASTAAQIGFVVLAAGAGVVAGGTAQLVAHAAVKAGLFVAAGAWLTSLGTKQLTGLRGAARRYRGIGAAATVAALSLGGIPPLSLWATKEEVLSGVDGAALRVVGLAASALSAVYAARMLVVLLVRPVGDEGLDDEEPGTRRVPGPATAVALVLAAAAAFLGALALPAVGSRLGQLVGAEPESGVATADLLLGGALAMLAFAGTVILLRFRPAVIEALSRSPLGSWGGLGHLLSPRPAIVLARAVATVDDRVIDRAVLGLAAAVRGLASLVSRADGSIVDGAVRGTARAFRRAGTAARRPQTGLLHQYYAQAAAGLGLLLVLLVTVR
ncbi:proton-conducting transporter transmembrane domain-containing protein [Modestobacter altitudinis]|uniref:proton-conducting transporter transmembrane domain-containing protein n=1 Tax=Modestobacter altitudinis TaxID=2213158 RepID=UPI001FE6DE3C|nr:proton-conducting transporter membrane subunit [Modestobacter altitudinis]